MLDATDPTPGVRRARRAIPPALPATALMLTAAWGLAHSAACAQTASLAQHAQGPQIGLYDLGYAYQASQKCAGVTLDVPVAAETHALDPFLSGARTFDENVQVRDLAWSCEAALKLFDARTGKAAKVLSKR